eukprot:403776_1
MLAVQPRGRHGAQEELRPVGVGSSVGHGQNTRAGVAQSEVLITELLAIDGLTTGAVATGEVTALAHELSDDPVESGSLEVQGLPAGASALLAGAQSPEVVSSPGDHVRAQRHLDAASSGPTDLNVKEHNGVGGHDGLCVVLK